MRKAIISRLMTFTNVVYKAVDIESNEIFNGEVSLGKTYKDDKALLKATKKAVETDRVTVIAIVSSKVDTALFGMSEETFLNVATRINSRNAEDIKCLFNTVEPTLETAGESN